MCRACGWCRQRPAPVSLVIVALGAVRATQQRKKAKIKANREFRNMINFMDLSHNGPLQGKKSKPDLRRFITVGS
jgi:hypothetical protein